MKFINGSIRNKIIFWMLISLTISSLTILTVTSQKINEDYINLTKQQLQLFSNNIFVQLRSKMSEGKTEELQSILDKAKTLENVADLKIIKGEKLITFSNSKEKFTQDKDILSAFYTKMPSIKEEKVNDKNYVKLITPIITTNECVVCHKNQDVGDVIAIMEVVFWVDNYSEHAKDIIWNIIYSSLFFGLLTIIVLLVIIQRVTEPIEGLKHGFKRLLASNEYGTNVKLQIRTQDEIGDVALLFNQYIDTLTLEFKKDTKKFAQSIMDTQSDLVVTFDENRNITNVNKTFLAYFDVKNIDDFITKYDRYFSSVFKDTGSSDFISEYVDGVFWEVYIENNKHKMHKVILQNKQTEAVFTVTTNSIVFDGKVFTTSVFTNIDELENIRREMEKGHKRLKSLFDNANEGFLYFGRDMIIGSEYSLVAKDIFDTKIEEKSIVDLLFDEDEEKIFIRDTLVGILDETKERQEILISLLKDEFLINKKFIKVQYKVIAKDTFMLILTDITQNKYLNEKIKDEQQFYKMVITVLTFLEDFKELKNDYETFTQDIKKFKTLEMLPTFRREIHTFKGLFAQFELLNIVKKLHSLENIIDYCLKVNELDDEIKYLTSETLYSWFKVDLNMINKVFKHNIFQKENSLKIEKVRIEKIYNNIEKYENLEVLKKDIEKLTYHNIKDSFYSYGQLIRTLSNRFEKPMNDFIFESDNIYLSDKYKPFLNGLVHIFRNSLDHGIESEEERYMKNKNPKGTISCKIKIIDNKLNIHYKDDGRGLDTEKIKSKILEKKLLSIEQIDKLDENTIYRFIFEDSFSTKDVITEISGRGVGLSLLKNEVEKLEGKIEIVNHPMQGVEFFFTLPLLD